MQTNTKRASLATHEGAPARHLGVLAQLRRSVLSCLLWETDAHAQQMASLREMIVDARKAAEAVGVQFTPIVNHPITWTI